MHAPKQSARPRNERRAFSLLELAAVVAILGLLAGMALTRFGHDTVAVGSADGLASRLSLALQLGRRQAISEGVPAALVLTRDSGAVVSATVVRATAGGDAPTEEVIDVPAGVTVTSATDRWEFDYRGVLTTPAAGGTLAIESPGWRWTLSVTAATGHVRTTRVAVP